MKCLSAKFLLSAVDPSGFPHLKGPRGEALPEIALIGRSNVGKSSLLNDLFQNKKLAKTSSVPGKTQCLNFYPTADGYIFVDLPGYGFAKAPLHEKKKWGEMIESYLNERASIKMLLFLLDIRRDPSEEDCRMLDWILFHKIPTILILTKTDKVNASEKATQTNHILGKFKQIPYVHYSAVRHEGRGRLITLMNEELSQQ